MLAFGAQYEAFCRRDPAWDGIVFVAVKTTHLSRLFAAHLGASPLQVALSLRVQRAKRLIDSTDLPIPIIAERAGFPSPRRMSAAFNSLYGRSPSALRRKRTPHAASR